ncbi:MAG: hypothetical protein DWH91_05520 [Planctomycetota bacterium]|nr:MAG: hypothetical protein DWH91_05520 [Planctomycetota bacterium]
MSSTMKSPPSGSSDGRPYVGFEEYIQFQLKLARQGIRGADLLTGAVGAVLLIVSYLLLFAVTDHWVIPGGWGPTGRYVLWSAFIAGLSWWGWRHLVSPFTQRISQLYAATQLEGASPELKSNLLTLVDLQQAGRAVSPAILESMERRAAVSLQQVNIDDAVDRQTLTKLSYALLGLVFVLCVYTVASPKSLVSSAWRALFPMAQVAPSTRTAILKVTPGDVTVLAHATPDITADLGGVIPDEVKLLYTTADRRVVDEVIRLQDTGEGVNRFRARLVGESGAGLLQNVSYRIEAGDAISPTYAITVRQPPTASVSEIFYDYPSYMGLEDRSQPESAIDAWEGTAITVRALANTPIDQATILFSDTEDTSIKAEELPMVIEEGVRLSAQWTLKFRSDGTFPRFYRIQLSRKTPDGGELVTVPTLHTQRIRPDLPPKLNVLYPTADLEAPTNGTIPVAFEASDPDFLLKSVVMRFEKEGELLPKQELLFDAPPFEAQTRGKHLLKLAPFSVPAGKTLTFWLEAKDNFEPFADRLGNMTRSARITVTVVEPIPPEAAQQKLQEQQAAADQKIAEAEQAANPQAPREEGDQPPPMSEEGPADPPMPPPMNGEPMPDQPMPQDGHPEPAPGDNVPPKPNEAEPNNAQPGNPQPGQSNQPGQKPSHKQPGGKQTQPGPSATDPATEPMPSEPQPGSSDSNPSGRSMPQPQPGQPQPGEQPPGKPQPGQPSPEQGPDSQPSDDNPAGQKPAESQPVKKPSAPREKLAPDEALEKLLRRQKEKEQQRQAQQPPQTPGAAPMPGDQNPTQTEADDPKVRNANSSDKGTASQENGPPKPMPGKKPGGPMPPSSENNPRTEPMPGDMSPENAPETPPPGNRTPQDPRNKPAPGAAKPMPDKAGEQPMNEPGEKPGIDPTTPMPNPDQPGTTPPGSEPTRNNPSAPGEKPMPTSKPQPGQKPMPGAPPQPGPEPGEPPMPGDKPGDKPGQQPDAGKPTPKPPGNNPPDNQSPNKQPGQSGPKQPSDMPGSSDQPGQPGEQPMPGDMPAEAQPGTEPGKPSNDPSKPGPQKTGPQQPSNPSSPQKPGQPGEKPMKPGDMPSGTDPGKPGEQPGDMPGDQPGASPSSPKPGQPSPSKQPGDTPGEAPSKPGNPTQPGKMPGDSPQPSDSPASEPMPGQNPGKGSPMPGDQPMAPGDQPASEEGPPGSGQKPGEKAKPGEQTMPGDESPSQKSATPPSKPGTKPGSKSVMPGDQSEQPGQPGKQPGQPGGKPGEGAGGGDPAPDAPDGAAGGDQPGSRNPGKGAVNGPPKNPGKNPDGTSGDGQTDLPPEAIDLENKKKAAALALEELREELSRGDVSQELLDDLGYTEDELDSFLKQLDERLNSAHDASSPESQARQRQFEELLKGIDLESEGQFKSGGDQERKATESTGSNRRPAPNKYRQAAEEYNKRIRGDNKK